MSKEAEAKAYEELLTNTIDVHRAAIIAEMNKSYSAATVGGNYEMNMLARQFMRTIQEHLSEDRPLFMSVGTAQIYLMDPKAVANGICSKCGLRLPTHDRDAKAEGTRYIPYFVNCPRCNGEVMREGEPVVH